MTTSVWCIDELGASTLPCSQEGNVLDLIRGGAAVVRVPEGGAVKVAFDIECVTPIVLANVRGFMRKRTPGPLELLNSVSTIRRFSGDYPGHAETYFTGVLEGRLQVSSRFLQWRENIARLPPALRTIALDYNAGHLGSPDLALTAAKWLDKEVRYICYSFPREGRDAIITDVSPRLRDAGTGWFKRSSGWSFHDFPDRDYATWTIASYRETLRTQAANAHRVSIDLVLTGGLRSRHDYYRLALPYWNGADTLSLVAVMADVDLTSAV